MAYDDPHLSDQDLLLLADGELAPGQTAKVRAHLEACWNCRTRMMELDRTIAAFVRQYHNDLDPCLPPIDGPAALLKAQLAGQARAGRSRGLFRFPAAHGRLAAAFFILVLSIGLGVLLSRIRTVNSQVARTYGEASSVPNTRLTPGATLPVSARDICATPSLEQNREVSAARQQAVFEKYGIHNPQVDAYEVDYLITPQLGGADSIQNLWPEPYFNTVWNAHVKDALEQRLYQLVCHGDLDLATAQRDISADWIAAYKKYFRTDKPLFGRQTSAPVYFDTGGRYVSLILGFR
jgi:hypothetical protein